MEWAPLLRPIIHEFWSSHRHTYRKWRIRAHRAYAQVGSKKQCTHEAAIVRDGAFPTNWPFPDPKCPRKGPVTCNKIQDAWDVKKLDIVACERGRLLRTGSREGRHRMSRFGNWLGCRQDGKRMTDPCQIWLNSIHSCPGKLTRSDYGRGPCGSGGLGEYSSLMGAGGIDCWEMLYNPFCFCIKTKTIRASQYLPNKSVIIVLF